jgi:enamine deaminase RidA (YjgF/YER057c/UK114 family)
METTKRLHTIASLAALCLSAAALILVINGCCGDERSAAAGPPVAISPPPTREVFGEDSEAGLSGAARYGDLVWTAGHLPDDTSGAADITQQTEEVMDGLKSTLEQAGAGFDSVVMTNVYLTDFRDWDAFNTVYRKRFTSNLPPRVTIQIGRLAFGKIEISMVAHVKKTVS